MPRSKQQVKSERGATDSTDKQPIEAVNLSDETRDETDENNDFIANIDIDEQDAMSDSEDSLDEDDLLDDDTVLLEDESLATDEIDVDETDDQDETQSKKTRYHTVIRTDRSSRRDDPVKTYLREIGQYPLLTKEEEVELATSMERGNLVHAIRQGAVAEERLSRVVFSKQAGVSLLPEDVKEELKEVVHAGKEAAVFLGLATNKNKIKLASLLQKKGQELEEIDAQARASRDRLTISNLRLVISIAKRYTNRGLSFLDLIQEGNMGLMKAVEKFDYKRGFKFSTYATWWIRQAITRAIADQSRTIRVPVHMIETVRDLKRIKREFIQQHGAAPTLEDISHLTGISIDRIKKIENVSSYTSSLERPIGDEDEDTLCDFIEDTSSPSPTKETFRMFLKEQLSRALGQLDEREREILKLRYGLDDDHPRTLKDVSLKFNITRERVRQIEIKAIEKLKHPSRRTELKRFRELLHGED
jgi:RNA polymerase primary sigma factor